MEEPLCGFAKKENVRPLVCLKYPHSSSSPVIIKQSLGVAKMEDELLTDNIEEEYDALNDETFGVAANDGDWETSHDKFAELVRVDDSLVSSLLDSSIFEGEDSQHEIISKSISQLGLEDDLDDPAIMTVGRSRNAWPLDTCFRSSPPPPAIIDTELCGSPNTHSIWSANHSFTPVKDSGICSLLKSISQSSHSYQQSPLPLSPVPSDFFSSPLPSKAWTVEEIEKNFVSSNSESCAHWSPSLGTHTNNYQGTSSFVDKSSVGDNAKEATCFLNDVLVHAGMRTLDDVERDILLKASAPTGKEIENRMQLKAETPVNKHVDIRNQNSPVPLKPKPALPSPIGTVHGVHQFHSTPTSMRSNMSDRILPNRLPFSGHKLPKGLEEKANNFYYSRPHPMLFPTSVLDPQTMNLPILPRRTIRHPLLHKELPGSVMWHQMDPNFFHGYNVYDARRKMSNGPDYDDDDYSNLMTQREKEWLTRINLMLTHPENPYVEDYYHSTLLLRKCTQEASKNYKNKGPKLLLPEKSKVEIKAYVPAQFEGSLGKLQAVSVNYPRKVLDITVSRLLEDDEGRIVTNQSLMKYRRLLIDIENMYNYLLEIDDEEKRILALPDFAQLPHKAKIHALINKIFIGLGCENVAVDDLFQNIMTVRKGRSLGMRAFLIFSAEQRFSYLNALFYCFATVLRKDQNDSVLSRYNDILICYIKKLNLSELVQLGENLENLIEAESFYEKSNFACAFRNKFGSTIVCCLLKRAEEIYARNEFIDSEIQARWARVVLHIVDILCILSDESIVPPSEAYMQLLIHFQRFAIDRDKFEILKEKVKLFEISLL